MTVLTSTPPATGDLGSPLRFADAASARAHLKSLGVNYVLAQFVDIHGVAKAKSVPLAHLETVLTDGAGFAGFAIWGVGIEPHGPDFMAVGDLRCVSLVPWQPGLARIVCEGHVNGKPWPYDSRVMLRAQLDRLSAKGWTLFTGLEPEFSLLKRGVNGKVEPCDASDTLAKPCYDYKGLSRTRVFLERLSDALRATGIDVYQIDHEDANGQFEMNYTYTDALTSCRPLRVLQDGRQRDRARAGADLLVHAQALLAPAGQRHAHAPVDRGRPTQPVPRQERPARPEPVDAGYHFLGGLLAHAPALAALCAPTVNSYKRLVVGRSLSGAPGRRPTSPTATTTARRWCACRRAGSNCACPTAPATRTSPRPACWPPGWTASSAGSTPASRATSTSTTGARPSCARPASACCRRTCMPHSTRCRPTRGLRALGPLAAEFLKLKRMEWVEYMRHVSDWETKTYLEFF
jgi:glutamine synthetase